MLSQKEKFFFVKEVYDWIPLFLFTDITISIIIITALTSGHKKRFFTKVSVCL